MVCNLCWKIDKCWAISYRSPGRRETVYGFVSPVFEKDWLASLKMRPKLAFSWRGSSFLHFVEIWKEQSEMDRWIWRWNRKLDQGKLQGLCWGKPQICQWINRPTAEFTRELYNHHPVHIWDVKNAGLYPVVDFWWICRKKQTWPWNHSSSNCSFALCK